MIDSEQANKEIYDALEQFNKTYTPEVNVQKLQNPTAELPMMVRWVIKLSGGKLQSQRQAEYMLLFFALIIFLISIYFFYGTLFAKSAILHRVSPLIDPTTNASIKIQK